MSLSKHLYAMDKLGAARPHGLNLDRFRGRGPLPTPSEGREHRVHNACGGKGCPGCSGTGYATCGPAAIRALEDRLGSAAEAEAKPVQGMLF
jgi:hypothetical protein